MKKILFTVLLALAAGAYVSAQSPNTRSESKVVVSGTYYYIHTVQKGETLSSLGRAYFTDAKTILASNPGLTENIKPDDVIKIPVVQETPSARSLRRATVHTVNKGEAPYSIAKRYAVSIDNLIAANPGLDPAKMKVGAQIVIPRDMIGSSTQTEVTRGFEQYKESLSELYPGYDFHLVMERETLHSLGREYNIDIEEIRKANPEELKDGLKYGSILKIPIPGGTVPSQTPSVSQPRTTYFPPSQITPTTPDEPERVTSERNRESREEMSGESHDTRDLANYHGDTEGEPAGVLRESAQPNIVILLPFTYDGHEERNIVDFYNGALVALDDLKKEGLSVSVNVFDSKRSANEVENLFSRGYMDNADLIIGPVYEEEFLTASEYAANLRIPIISPLAPAPDNSNRFVYQIAPGQEYRYDKLKSLFAQDYNVVMIDPLSGVDSEFRSEMMKIAPFGFKRVSYSGSSISDPLRDALSSDRENIIIIPTSDKIVLNDIMTKIATVQNHVSSRGMRPYRIRTVGTANWASFTDLDRELFFKLGVIYVTSYHADRSHPAVAAFDSKFIEKFSYLPSGLYSYAYRGRGYDITKLFVSSIAQGVSPNNTSASLLQVNYSFVQDGRFWGGKWTNNQWTVVKYNTDYTITTE